MLVQRKDDMLIHLVGQHVKTSNSSASAAICRSSSRVKEMERARTD